MSVQDQHRAFNHGDLLIPPKNESNPLTFSQMPSSHFSPVINISLLTKQTLKKGYNTSIQVVWATNTATGTDNKLHLISILQDPELMRKGKEMRSS